MGGTETWVITMARELQKQGHEVRVYTKQKGMVSQMLGDMMTDNIDDGYDLALINHNSCIDVKAKVKIFTSHGTIPPLEQPVEGADEYVAVSENVAEKYKLKHIIKNPIDTELFKPTSDIRDKPEVILNITNEKFNLPYKFLSPTRSEYSTPTLMNKADIIISLGRGALEAMSCGRNVITWDNRGYWGQRGDGYLSDFSKLKGNVAGEYRRTNIDIQQEILKYNKEQGKLNREYILKNHDVKLIVKQYLDLCREKLLE